MAQYPLNMGNKKATVSFGPHFLLTFLIYLLTFVFMIALLVTCTSFSMHVVVQKVNFASNRLIRYIYNITSFSDCLC